jgi:hypothetical protein
MMRLHQKILPVALALATAASPALAQVKGETVSTGPRFELKKALVLEGTTILLFINETSAIERQFLADLESRVPETKRVGLRVVRVKDVKAPAAAQYQVETTPTVLVYDRFGRVLARTSEPEQIRAAVRKGMLMGRISWVDEDDPKAPEVYGMPPERVRRGVPGILKTFSPNPKAFQLFMGLSEIHFSDGYLKRREHEMIASYVSSLNKCRF